MSNVAEAFRVHVNMYSHEGSAFSDECARYDTIDEAKYEADRQVEKGFKRFAFVTDAAGERLYVRTRTDGLVNC